MHFDNVDFPCFSICQYLNANFFERPVNAICGRADALRGTMVFVLRVGICPLVVNFVLGTVMHRTVRTAVWAVFYTQGVADAEVGGADIEIITCDRAAAEEVIGVVWIAAYAPLAHTARDRWLSASGRYAALATLSFAIRVAFVDM